jgi:two-component system chemotaxis sensor kinase CheA
VNDIVREFIVETNENLAQLDLDLVTLEKDPKERETLARVFRTLHTVKGTAGFLGLTKLQAVAHAGENLLGRLRAGELTFNPEIATALLGVVDAIRAVLAALEGSEQEGHGDYSALIQTLERLTSASRAVLKPQLVPSASPASSTATPVAATPEPAAVVVGPIRMTIPEPSQALPPAPAPVSVITQEPAEARSAAVADRSIRVDVGLLDKLMTLVGELVLARNQMVQFGATQEDSGFLGTLQRLNLLTTELQAGVMKTRMQPVGNLWAKFPRVVRDLAVACGKQVRIDMDGQETELDKTIIEAIRTR